MALKLDLCKDEDMARVFELVSSSFAHEHPYIDAVFPEHESPLGRKAGAERMLSAKADPNATFVKVTDETTGEILGIAKWLIFRDSIPEELNTLPAIYYENETAKEYAEYMFGEYLKPRRQAIRENGGNLVSLDLMCVDPKHQRRGVGKTLMGWGINIADELGVEAVVEASTEGRGLYEAFGFVMQREIIMENPEQHSSKPKQKYFWMHRASKRSST